MELSSALSPLACLLETPVGEGWAVSPSSAGFAGTATGSAWSPFSPLAPVLGSEVQTLGVDPKKPLEHSPFVPIHDVLRQCEDILALDRRRGQAGQPTWGLLSAPLHTPVSPCLPPYLVVVDEVEVL